MDWEWLVRGTKLSNLRTALGFVVTLARAGAESRQLKDRATRFRAVEELLRDGTQRIWISGKLSSNQATS